MSDPNDAENYLAHPDTNAAMEDAAEIERLWADLKDSHTEIERLREQVRVRDNDVTNFREIADKRLNRIWGFEREIKRLRELQSIVCEVVFNERHDDTLGMRKLCAWVHKNVVIGGEDE